VSELVHLRKEVQKLSNEHQLLSAVPTTEAANDKKEIDKGSLNNLWLNMRTNNLELKTAVHDLLLLGKSVEQLSHEQKLLKAPKFDQDPFLQNDKLNTCFELHKNTSNEVGEIKKSLDELRRSGKNLSNKRNSDDKIIDRSSMEQVLHGQRLTSLDGTCTNICQDLRTFENKINQVERSLDLQKTASSMLVKDLSILANNSIMLFKDINSLKMSVSILTNPGFENAKLSALENKRSTDKPSEKEMNILISDIEQLKTKDDNRLHGLEVKLEEIKNWQKENVEKSLDQFKSEFKAYEMNQNQAMKLLKDDLFSKLSELVNNGSVSVRWMNGTADFNQDGSYLKNRVEFLLKEKVCES